MLELAIFTFAFFVFIICNGFSVCKVINGKIPHMNDFMMTTFLIVVVCTAATNIYSEYVYKIIGKMKDTHIILLQGDAKTLEDAANKAGLDSKYIDKLHEYIKFPLTQSLRTRSY